MWIIRSQLYQLLEEIRESSGQRVDFNGIVITLMGTETFPLRWKQAGRLEMNITVKLRRGVGLSAESEAYVVDFDDGGELGRDRF